MIRVLLLDCYLDEVGCARHFLPALGQGSKTVRCAHQSVPDTGGDWEAIVITGSAASVLDELPWIARLEALARDALRRDVPLLGVCFGHQLLAKVLGGPGAVRRSPAPELGWFEVETVGDDTLLARFPRRFRTFCSHFEEVDPGANGVEVLARSPRCAVQAFRVPGARAFGVQFHAEMDAEETERLLRERSAQHPELGIDVAAELAGRVDTAALRDVLLASFLSLASSSQPREPLNGDSR